MSDQAIPSIEMAGEEAMAKDTEMTDNQPPAMMVLDSIPIFKSVEPTTSHSTPLSSLTHSNATSRGSSTGPSSVSPSNQCTSNQVPGSNSTFPTGPTVSQPVPGTAKRRKLTSAEQEVKAFEKAEKERAKQIAAALKQEEKRIKEESKAQKELEKEEARQKREAEKVEKQRQKDEERRVKEEEKRAKDEEKAKREEEIAKKERAQKKLSFFATPVRSVPAQAAVLPISKTGTSPQPNTNSGSPARLTSSSSDYERTFLPFSIPQNVIIGPHNLFDRDEEGKTYVRTQLDQSLPRVDIVPEVTTPAPPVRHDFSELCHIPHARRGRRGLPRQLPTRHEIDSQTYNISTLPALKYISFHQDVRVPYIGTYTKRPLHRTLSSLGRRPFQHLRPDTCYEEDSEAEWEEPEEGEDLMSEAGDDDGSANEEDEMEDFLDDEDDPGVQRRGAVKGELVPVCSGICWQDPGAVPEKGVIQHHRMDILLEGVTSGIDPYSTAYWITETSVMGPPPPLLKHQTSRVSPAMHVVTSGTAVQASALGPLSACGEPLLDGQLLEEFKKEVSGSDMTKIAMVEHLKKRFRGVKQAILKSTLDAVAERVGSRAADKRWMLRPEPNPPTGQKRAVLNPILAPNAGVLLVSSAGTGMKVGAKPKKVLDLAKMERVA